jgi:hypothetical protein
VSFWLKERPSPPPRHPPLEYRLRCFNGCGVVWGFGRCIAGEMADNFPLETGGRKTEKTPNASGARSRARSIGDEADDFPPKTVRKGGPQMGDKGARKRAHVHNFNKKFHSNSSIYFLAFTLCAPPQNPHNLAIMELFSVDFVSACICLGRKFKRYSQESKLTHLPKSSSNSQALDWAGRRRCHSSHTWATKVG